jgi:excisionase family DNA binding protein
MLRQAGGDRAAVRARLVPSATGRISRTCRYSPQMATIAAEVARDVEHELLTVAEVARLLRVSNDTVRRWIIGGELPAVRVGHNYRVLLDDLHLPNTLPDARRVR